MDKSKTSKMILGTSLTAMASTILLGSTTTANGADTVRFATFNTSLSRNSSGELITDLSTPDDS